MPPRLPPGSATKPPKPTRKTTHPTKRTGARPTREYVVAGRIVRPHGLRGQVVVDPESEVMGRLTPGHVVHLGPHRRKVRLLSLQPHQGRYLISLEGVGDRMAAESLRDDQIECRLEDIAPLPPGMYFRWQIVGLRAVADDGRELGEIAEVFATGANDVYEVRQPDGPPLLLPAISSVVKEIDLERGVVRVHLLPGLIDPA